MIEIFDWQTKLWPLRGNFSHIFTWLIGIIDLWERFCCRPFLTVWSSWFSSIPTHCNNQTKAGLNNSLVPCAINVSIHYCYWKQRTWPRWWQHGKGSKHLAINYFLHWQFYSTGSFRNFSYKFVLPILNSKRSWIWQFGFNWQL